MTLQIERKVMGSLSHEMGDCVLAYSAGVTPTASALCATVAHQSRTDGASLYLFTHPKTCRYTALHVQGGYTTFAGDGRSYTQRAVYETEASVLTQEGGSTATLVGHLDGMHPYDAPCYDCRTDVEVEPSVAASLDDQEERLLRYIAYSIIHGRQLFIRLGDDERLHGDALRQSARLKSLLRAIDALPPGLRPHASVGYAVESGDAGIQALFGQLLIVCHHDDIGRWGNASEAVIQADWTLPRLRTVNARRATDGDMQRLREVAPMLTHFMADEPPTLDRALTLMRSIPSNIDRVLRKQHPDDNDRLIIETALKAGPGTYRHAEMSNRMGHSVTSPTDTRRKKTDMPRKQTGDTSHPPTIDNRWLRRHKRTLLLGTVALVAIVAVATLLKSFTEMGRSAASDVYVPSSDAGFVGKANALLAHLVARGNTVPYDTIHPHTVADLERRYPGLHFALPYGKEVVEGGRAADLRLVDIDAEAIAEEGDLRFFHNSDVPSLLRRQREQLGERIFHITFSDATSLEIESIRLVPSMFKVALEKNPWGGTILAAESSLFPASNHCYVSWGKTVVPVRMSGEGHIHTDGGHVEVMDADADSHRLTMAGGQPIDYYRLYQAYRSDTTTLCIRLSRTATEEIYIDYVDGQRLRVKPVGLYCHVHGTDAPTAVTRPLSSSADGDVYRMDGDLKLTLTRGKDSERVAELTVSRRDPMRTLSTLVHSSAGATRYNISREFTDRFTQQVTDGLTATLRHTHGADTLQLSIDPLLSAQMEKELADYCRTLRRSGKYNADDEWELSLTMMDMATGSIVGAPYYRSSDEGLDPVLAQSRKNPALMRRYVGSTFKPLVALAAVLTRPELSSLDTEGQYRLLPETTGGTTSTPRALFMGHETQAWSLSAESRSFWSGCHTMAEFLAKSDDVYPVAIVCKALGYGASTGSPFVYTRHDVHLATSDNFTWASSPFIRQIDRLYTLPGVKDYQANDSLQMAYYVWDALHVDAADRFCLDNVSPDPTLLYYTPMSRPGATLKADLVPWVLGQGSNEWNSLKLAEAWTRMLTKRKVSATFVAGTATTATDLSDGYSQTAWNALLRSLRDAQRQSPRLLTPMYDAVAQLCRDEHIADTLVLLSKTGTPENYLREEWKRIESGPLCIDMGLYCMALMPASAYRSVQHGGKASGLMCVVRVTRLVDRRRHPQAMPGGPDHGISSADARNFLSSSPQRLRRLYHLTRRYYQ